MRSHLFRDQFADITVNRLINPGKGEPFLIVADPKNDLNLAEALLTAGLRSGAVGYSRYLADIMMVKPDIYLDGKLMNSANRLGDGYRFNHL